jgi:hypothetical protein
MSTISNNTEMLMNSLEQMMKECVLKCVRECEGHEMEEVIRRLESMTNIFVDNVNKEKVAASEWAAAEKALPSETELVVHKAIKEATTRKEPKKAVKMTEEEKAAKEAEKAAEKAAAAEAKKAALEAEKEAKKAEKAAALEAEKEAKKAEKAAALAAEKEAKAAALAAEKEAKKAA